MEETEIKYKDRTFKIHELDYYEFASREQIADKKEKEKQLFKLSGVPEDLINNMPLRLGLQIQKAINKLNGFDEDFQAPPISTPTTLGTQ